MLTIRLSRIGKKNKPMYRLIISEKSRDLYGRALEILGSYNPHSKELQAKTERINYWLDKGAGMSPTVNNLLVGKGLIKGEKIKASKVRTKKKEEKKKPIAEANAPAAGAKKEESKGKGEKTEEKIDNKNTKIEEKQPENQPEAKESSPKIEEKEKKQAGAEAKKEEKPIEPEKID